MDIKSYYNNEFQKDILDYCKKRNDGYHFYNNNNTITDGDVFRRIRLSDSKLFANPYFTFCFYFTVLTDEMIFDHFQNSFSKFDNATLYPKIYGLGVKQRLFPRSILYNQNKYFQAINQLIPSWEETIDFFINEWYASLYKFDISIEIFLFALINDKDLLKCNDGNRFEDILEQRLIERVKNYYQENYVK